MAAHGGAENKQKPPPPVTVVCVCARATAVCCLVTARRSKFRVVSASRLLGICRLLVTGIPPPPFVAERKTVRVLRSSGRLPPPQSRPARGDDNDNDGVSMVVHHGATSVTGMEVDPPRNANSPDDPKTANGSSENEKAEDSESSEDGPLDVGEHYLVRRYDDTWRK